MNDHVLVTYYRNPITGQVIMHAYGPWTQAKADRERRRTLAENAQDALRGHFTAKACKMLDVTG